MSKVIKLKQGDLERIVENIVKEQEWKGSMDPDEKDTSNDGVPLTLAKDENGNYYVIQDDGGDKPKIFKINK
jgi:hypothetical protein